MQYPCASRRGRNFRKQAELGAPRHPTCASDARHVLVQPGQTRPGRCGSLQLSTYMSGTRVPNLVRACYVYEKYSAEPLTSMLGYVTT